MSIGLSRAIVLASALLAAAVTEFASVAVAQEKTSLVLAQTGSIPIIITAPHGGRASIPGVPPRDTAGKKGGGSGFYTLSDLNTDLLAQAIAARVAALTGRKPYLVVANFKRLYIDANRPPEIAYDNPAAQPAYDLYHGSVRQFVDEIRRKYPAGLLLDIHGQGRQTDVLMRGTQNGRAVTRLVARAGEGAITGADGLFGKLAANGFKVFPPNDKPLAGSGESSGFDGGFTVQTYGSQTPNGIDAIQMEFGMSYRERAAISKSADATARAIAAFYATYLK